MHKVLWLVSILSALTSLVASAAPEVSYLYPVGGQRGQTLEVTVGGKFSQWPVHVWTSDAAVSALPLEEKGKLKIEIDEKAAPGLIWLRLYDPTGAATPRPWMIGSAPESVEIEPNDQASTAQPLQFKSDALQTIIINGQLQKSGDVDVFSIPAHAGQTLVADLDAQATFQSPFDGVMQILRPDGFVAAHNDDQLQLDPRLAVDLPIDGRWMVRVYSFPEKPNNVVQISGKETYVYRLLLSTGPVVNYALPLAIRRGQDNHCQLMGWNLPNDLKEITLTPPDDADDLLLANAKIGQSIRLPIVDHQILVESEPNTKVEPIQITLPMSITGRIDEPEDIDAFQFDAVKGEQLMIKIESRELGYPLDPVLELVNASDKSLTRVDDSAGGRDARISYQVAADGPLRLVISDLHHSGGADFVYRVSIERAKPSYRLNAENHQVLVKAGESTDIPLAVERTHGFDRPIRISVDGLPEGVTATTVTSKVGDDSASKVVVSFVTTADTSATSVPIRLVGEVDSATSTPARFPVPGHPHGLSQMWLTVTPSKK